MPKTLTTKPKVFLYCRKSSEAEDRQILSIESQVIELKRFAAKAGVEILEILTEAKSAKAPGVRLVFNSMMTRLYRGEADGVLCWKLDRLARNPVDGGSIIWAMKQHGITIITPVQTFSQAEDNVVWMYLEFGMAQKYVDDLSRNVKRGLKTKAEMGWFPGLIPSGYVNRTQPNGRKTIAKDPKRFSIIRQCWEFMLTGKYTPADVREIANTVLGFRTVNGNPMAESTIYHIFSSRFYYGTYEYPKASGVWHIGRHTPMVTKNEFDQVQRLLSRGRKWPKNRKVFAFTGLIRCGKCNRAITAEEKRQLICSICQFKFSYRGKEQCPKCKTSIKAMRNPTKLHYTYYHCSSLGKLGCGQRSVELRDILAQFDRTLSQVCLPVAHEQWMQGQLRNTRGSAEMKSPLTAIRETFNRSGPEHQRQIITSIMDNIRLVDHKLSLDLKIPFHCSTEFDLGATSVQETLLNEPLEKQVS